jgi:flavin reductase (DIM6/NTAB) family NADH-FMN oxidoreductase RutF
MDTNVNTKDRTAVLEKMTNGLYIVTTRKKAIEMDTRNEDYLAAGTIAWATQSSFEPPMVTIAVQKDSDLAETIARSYQFSLHILGLDQQDMAKDFAKESTIDRVHQKINGYDFHEGLASNLPVLNGTIGYLECVLKEISKTEGDHILFTGEVMSGEIHQEKAQPLHEWRTGLHYGG